MFDTKTPTIVCLLFSSIASCIHSTEKIERVDQELWPQNDFRRSRLAFVDFAKGCCAIGEQSCFYPIKRAESTAVQSLNGSAQINGAIGIVPQEGDFLEGDPARVETRFVILQANMRNDATGINEAA